MCVCVSIYLQGRSNDWQLEFKGSPGNLVQFENLLFAGNEMLDGNSTISVNLKVNGQQKVCIKMFFFLHNKNHCDRI